MGFAIKEADKCISTIAGRIIYLYYVCMLMIFWFFCTNIVAINEVKSFLSKSFDIKAMGEDDVILNIKLIKDDIGITLYNLTILRRSWTNLIL